MRTVIDKLEENGIPIDEEGVMVIDDEALVESLVGISSDYRAVYDMQKMAEELMKAYNMEYADAIEHIEYNIIRSLPYYGDKAPIIYDPLE